MKNKTACTRANGFTLWEKIWAQCSFIAMGIIGAVGIARVDWRWALLYLVIYWYGIMGVVMRHVVCPRCPHLHVYNDCLQAPKTFTSWLVKTRKTTPLSAFEKCVFCTYFLLIATYPLYWVMSQKMLLIAFLLMVIMWYSGQFFHFCKRCRVDDCPFNRAPIPH